MRLVVGGSLNGPILKMSIQEVKCALPILTWKDYGAFALQLSTAILTPGNGEQKQKERIMLGKGGGFGK